MAQYPDEIYTPRTLVNKPGTAYDEAKTSRLFAEDQNGTNDEIIAIQEELGTNPKGTYDNVKARIVANEAIATDITKAAANAAGSIINAIYNLVSNIGYIKGLWLFDNIAATTGVKDRGICAHDLTLNANASDCSPAISGLARTLKLDDTHIYTAADHDDFSCIGKRPFTIIWLGKPTSVNGCTLLSKYDATPGSIKTEWTFFFYTDSKIYCQCYDAGNQTANRIGRTHSTELTDDVNSFHVYVATYDGGTTHAAIKIYRDGVRIDDGNNGNGVFADFGNTTAQPASYITDITGKIYARTKAHIAVNTFIRGEALSAAKIFQISQVLLAYANSLAT